MSHGLPYGWRDFDEDVVFWLTEQHPENVVKRTDGGMTCPLVAHDREWLRWQDENYAKGSIPHAEPEVSFRVSPTYVLSDARDNFIAGRPLIDQLLGGAWDKAETHRLGNENSEDALTWNVFRSLQEGGLLRALTPLLCECRLQVEPDLYLWGRRILDAGAEPWERLAHVRVELEPMHRQQTEPDAVLHLPGWGWVFIEAKFGSRVTTSPNEERMQQWLRRYPEKSPWLFNLDECGEVPPHEFPEQLLRNIVFADRVAHEGERAHVVLLTREKESTPVEDWLGRCLSEDAEVTFSRLSWEAIYRALPDDPALSTLRHYLDGKSYALRRAFNV